MPEFPSPVPETTTPLTRRGLIRNAASAGAAVAAAGLLAGATTGQAHAVTPAHAPEQERAAELTEPLMVRVVDARTGALDVFHGDTHRTVHNRQLTQALINAAS